MFGSVVWSIQFVPLHNILYSLKFLSDYSNINEIKYELYR